MSAAEDSNEASKGVAALEISSQDPKSLRQKLEDQQQQIRKLEAESEETRKALEKEASDEATGIVGKAMYKKSEYDLETRFQLCRSVGEECVTVS